MKIATIIVAAGAGKRLDNAADALPKQFLTVGQKMILMRTIENFTYLSGEIVVVLPPNYIDYWVEQCARCGFRAAHKVAAGGGERTESVLAGIDAISDDVELILVQDGVRPFTSREVIDRVVVAASTDGAAVPALPLTDSLRSAKGAISRNGVFAVQTPQGFLTDILKSAYQQNRENLTDDATVVNNAGYTVTIVDGDAKNIKITTPFDLKIAEILC